MKEENEYYPELDRKIVSALEKLTQVYRILFWEIAKKEKLSPIQIQILEFLDRYPEQDRRVSILAGEFDLTKATVSDAVRTLVEKGLVTSESGADDRRSHVLSLTREGKKLVQRISRWMGPLLECVHGAPDEEKKKVLRFLVNTIRTLFDNGVIRIARMCPLCENFAAGEGNENGSCMLTGRAISSGEITLGCTSYRQKKTAGDDA